MDIAPQRKLPQFSPQTFKSWFRQRRPRNRGGEPVILWPDTFNNYFHADTAKAAVEVLAAAAGGLVLAGIVLYRSRKGRSRRLSW